MEISAERCQTTQNEQANLNKSADFYNNPLLSDKNRKQVNIVDFLNRKKYNQSDLNSEKPPRIEKIIENSRLESQPSMQNLLGSNRDIKSVLQTDPSVPDYQQISLTSIDRKLRDERDNQAPVQAKQTSRGLIGKQQKSKQQMTNLQLVYLQSKDRISKNSTQSRLFKSPNQSDDRSSFVGQVKNMQVRKQFIGSLQIKLQNQKCSSSFNSDSLNLSQSLIKESVKRQIENNIQSRKLNTQQSPYSLAEFVDIDDLQEIQNCMQNTYATDQKKSQTPTQSESNHKFTMNSSHQTNQTNANNNQNTINDQSQPTPNQNNNISSVSKQINNNKQNSKRFQSAIDSNQSSFSYTLKKELLETPIEIFNKGLEENDAQVDRKIHLAGYRSNDNIESELKMNDFEGLHLPNFTDCNRTTTNIEVLSNNEEAQILQNCHKTEINQIQINIVPTKEQVYSASVMDHRQQQIALENNHLRPNQKVSIGQFVQQFQKDQQLEGEFSQLSTYQLGQEQSICNYKNTDQNLLNQSNNMIKTENSDNQLKNDQKKDFNEDDNEYDEEDEYLNTSFEDFTENEEISQKKPKFKSASPEIKTKRSYNRYQEDESEFGKNTKYIQNFLKQDAEDSENQITFKRDENYIKEENEQSAIPQSLFKNADQSKIKIKSLNQNEPKNVVSSNRDHKNQTPQKEASIVPEKTKQSSEQLSNGNLRMCSESEQRQVRSNSNMTNKSCINRETLENEEELTCKQNSIIFPFIRNPSNVENRKQFSRQNSPTKGEQPIDKETACDQSIKISQLSDFRQQFPNWNENENESKEIDYIRSRIQNRLQNIKSDNPNQIEEFSTRQYSEMVSTTTAAAAQKQQYLTVSDLKNPNASDYLNQTSYLNTEPQFSPQNIKEYKSASEIQQIANQNNTQINDRWNYADNQLGNVLTGHAGSSASAATAKVCSEQKYRKLLQEYSQNQFFYNQIKFQNLDKNEKSSFIHYSNQEKENEQHPQNLEFKNDISTIDIYPPVREFQHQDSLLRFETAESLQKDKSRNLECRVKKQDLMIMNESKYYLSGQIKTGRCIVSKQRSHSLNMVNKYQNFGQFRNIELQNVNIQQNLNTNTSILIENTITFQSKKYYIQNSPIDPQQPERSLTPNGNIAEIIRKQRQNHRLPHNNNNNQKTISFSKTNDQNEQSTKQRLLTLMVLIKTLQQFKQSFFSYSCPLLPSVQAQFS